MSLLSASQLVDYISIHIRFHLELFSSNHENFTVYYVYFSLEFFLVSDTHQENIKTVGIIPSVQSDRSAITPMLCPVSQSLRERAYWKFNTSLTQDNYFIDSLKSQIPIFARKVFSVDDPIMRRKYVKYKCRKFSLSYSIKKAKERKSRQISQEKRIVDLESLISSSSSQELLNEYNKCKPDLETLYDYITAEIILQSKSDWYEYSEKSSKNFLNLGKHNKAKSHMRKLLTETDDEISNPSEIMIHIKDFYSSLYKQRSLQTEAEC